MYIVGFFLITTYLKTEKQKENNQLKTRAFK